MSRRPAVCLAASQAAGLHPEWRALHLAHLRATRAFARAYWNRAGADDRARALRAAQAEAAACRRRWAASRAAFL